VLIDELADLCMVGGRSVQDALARLAQRGREAGLHLVACTQRPTAAAIGSLVKSNFPVRVVGSVASAEDAKVASGLPGTGAERLLGGGDFVVVARGEQIRVQAAYISPRDCERMAARIGAEAGGRGRAGAEGVGRRVVEATKRLVSGLPVAAGAPH
jgi:S-DNA-T family DNA segregation ATPase FtsK/SpoIIIE